MYAQRLEAASDIGDMLQAIFRAQRNAFKINLAFGFILSNVETREKRYYYPSQVSLPALGLRFFLFKAYVMLGGFLNLFSTFWVVSYQGKR